MIRGYMRYKMVGFSERHRYYAKMRKHHLPVSDNYVKMMLLKGWPKGSNPYAGREVPCHFFCFLQGFCHYQVNYRYGTSVMQSNIVRLKTCFIIS